jgi:YHS domain-containing protein
MRNRASIAIVLLASMLVMGCKEKTPPADVPKEPAKDAATTSAAPVDSAAVLAKLAAADKLDGAEDKLVSKCYMCSLGMDGEEQYTAEYEGYKVRLCSDHCLEEFNKDPAGVIARTDVPAN